VLLHHAAWLSWLARRYDEAIEFGRKVLELDPGFGWAYFWTGLALEQQSRHGDAIAALTRCRELAGNVQIFTGSLGHAYARAGQAKEAQRLLGELEGHSQHGYADPYAIALIHAGRGESDRVFEWLEKGYEDRTTWITVFTKADPRLDPFRQDPRFAALLRRMRLES
jgi:tetratricopeptide (TPR) repeat protein